MRMLKPNLGWRNRITFSIVKYLVEQCHANVESKDCLGFTALHRACCRCNLDIVKNLVEQGKANVEART
jgi:ankyrin repeat protein